MKKTLATLAATTCALLTTTFAVAQGDEATPDAPPSAASAAPAAPAPALKARPDMPVTACRAGEHSGIDEVDAATATQLVCAEIARAGAPAGTQYRVTLGRLGTMIILTVSRDGDSPDTIADSREARLHGIEEVSLAAPRIADAIVHGTSLKETETVNNLVADETRTPATKSAKLHFALGLIGQFPPLSRSLSPIPGANLELHAEANPFQIVGNFRFGYGDGRSGGGYESAFVDFSVGGRWFASDANLAPYLGAGLSWGWLELTGGSTANGEWFDGSNNGLGAYVEGGVEILRTHHAHLAFGLRADAPFFALRSSGDYAVAPTLPGQDYAPPQLLPTRTLYYVPISFELRLTF